MRLIKCANLLTLPFRFVNKEFLTQIYILITKISASMFRFGDPTNPVGMADRLSKDISEELFIEHNTQKRLSEIPQLGGVAHRQMPKSGPNR